MPLQPRLFHPSAVMRSARAVLAMRRRPARPDRARLRAAHQREAPVRPEPSKALSDPIRTFEARHCAEEHSSPAVQIMKRGLSLASDTVVLTLAAPFFAVWFTYRAIRNWLRPEA